MGRRRCGVACALSALGVVELVAHRTAASDATDGGARAAGGCCGGAAGHVRLLVGASHGVALDRTVGAAPPAAACDELRSTRRDATPHDTPADDTTLCSLRRICGSSPAPGCAMQSVETIQFPHTGGTNSTSTHTPSGPGRGVARRRTKEPHTQKTNKWIHDPGALRNSHFSSSFILSSSSSLS